MGFKYDSVLNEATFQVAENNKIWKIYTGQESVEPVKDDNRRHLNKALTFNQISVANPHPTPLRLLFEMQSL